MMVDTILIFPNGNLFLKRNQITILLHTSITTICVNLASRQFTLTVKKKFPSKNLIMLQTSENAF